MRGVNRGEVWMVDLGMAAKVRPALLLTGDKKTFADVRCAVAHEQQVRDWEEESVGADC